jgi:hypothetical protein
MWDLISTYDYLYKPPTLYELSIFIIWDRSVTRSHCPVLKNKTYLTVHLEKQKGLLCKFILTRGLEGLLESSRVFLERSWPGIHLELGCLFSPRAVRKISGGMGECCYVRCYGNDRLFASWYLEKLCSSRSDLGEWSNGKMTLIFL